MLLAQDVCNSLRKQLGRPKTPDKQKPDLTENGLQAMAVAGDRLQVASASAHQCCKVDASNWFTLRA